MPDSPHVETVLIGDQVIHDSISRKWSVVGVYNQVLCTQLPVTHRGLGIFVSFSDVYQPLPIGLQVMDPEGRPLFRAAGVIKPSAARTGYEQFGAQVEWLNLVVLGRHAVQVMDMTDESGGGRIMGETQFKLMEVPPRPKAAP